MRLELGCNLHQIFSVSRAMLLTPSCLLWVEIQLFCAYFKCQWRLFTARKVLLWSGCWRHSSVAEYICVSWIRSQHAATHAKRNQTLLQGVFAACPHQVHVPGKDRDCSVVLLSFRDQAVLVPRAAAVTDPCEVLTLARGGRLLHLVKVPSGSVERMRFNVT